MLETLPDSAFKFSEPTEMDRILHEVSHSHGCQNLAEYVEWVDTQAKSRWIETGKMQQKMLEDLHSIGSIRIRPA